MPILKLNRFAKYVETKLFLALNIHKAMSWSLRSSKDKKLAFYIVLRASYSDHSKLPLKPALAASPLFCHRKSGSGAILWGNM